MLEPIVWIYRFDEDKGTYSSSCTIISAQDNTVIIKGLSGSISTREFGQLRKDLRNKGIEEVIYKRRGIWKHMDFRERIRREP